MASNETLFFVFQREWISCYQSFLLLSNAPVLQKTMLNVSWHFCDIQRFSEILTFNLRRLKQVSSL